MMMKSVVAPTTHPIGLPARIACATALLQPGRAMPEAARPPCAASARARPARTGGLAAWQEAAIERHIRANIDTPLSVAELAALVRVSIGHFFRAFRASFGCAPKHYVLRLRLESAQRLMVGSDEPLGQIALICGFSDQPHFSRVFRSMTRETPSRWRRSQRQPAALAPFPFA